MTIDHKVFDFNSTSTDFSYAVHACAAGLKFKNPKEGLDQTLAKIILEKAEKGETLTTGEMKSLAALLCGFYIPYKSSTRPSTHTTDEVIKIVKEVERLQQEDKATKRETMTYENAIRTVSKSLSKLGMKSVGVKTIEGYIAALGKYDETTRRMLGLVKKEKQEQKQKT